jgi:hypothetical protein
MTGAFGIQGAYLIKLINSQGRVFASVSCKRGKVTTHSFRNHPGQPEFLKDLLAFSSKYSCRTFYSADHELNDFIKKHIVELISVKNNAV